MAFFDYLILILAMGAVTYLPRSLPLLALSQRRIPPWLVDWLSLIPVALLAALVAPILFVMEEPRILSLGKPELLAAFPTFFFAWKTRSLGGTALVGMASYWALGSLL